MSAFGKNSSSAILAPQPDVWKLLYTLRSDRILQRKGIVRWD